MSERVKVDPSEIEVGDLIEVETPHETGAVTIRRDTVTSVDASRVVTREFSFSRYFDAEPTQRTYYRLPKPPMAEPQGLGALVMDKDGDVWVHVQEGWVLGEDDPVGWSVVLTWGPLTVKSNGYTK